MIDRVQEVVDQIALVIRFISAFAIAAGVIILATALLAVVLRRQIATLRVDRDGTTFADGVAVNLAA